MTRFWITERICVSSYGGDFESWVELDLPEGKYPDGWWLREAKAVAEWHRTSEEGQRIRGRQIHVERYPVERERLLAYYGLAGRQPAQVDSPPEEAPP